MDRVFGDVLWKPRLVDAFNVQTQLFANTLGIGGPGVPSFGAITIAIGDAPDDDELVDGGFLYDGRTLQLFVGGDPEDGWTFENYFEVFRGVAEDAIWTEQLLSFVVRDPSARLDVPMQATLYAGTGDDEGGEDLKGKPKPIAYGRPRNLSPVLVDRTYLIYQFHDGAAVAVDAVYDRGDAYTADGDEADTTDLRAWEPVEGESKFRTCLAQGMFRLGSTPNGLVTSDVQGDSDSGTLREKQGELQRRILKARAGFTDDEIDLASLAALDANGRELSLYLTEPATVASVLDQINQPRGYRTFDTTGRYRAGQVQIGSASGTIQAPNILSISRERTQLPAYRVSLGYARNWTPMRSSDLAASSLDLDADFAENEYRRVTANDDDVWDPDAHTGKHPLARDVTLDTFWNDETDAQAEVDDLFALVSADRNLYRVLCRRIQFRYQVGQTVRVVHPRFGLSGGQLFVILGLVENTTTGQTELRLWG
jgi:hypothetical protein